MEEGKLLGQCLNCARENIEIVTRKKSITKPCIADLTFVFCEKCAVIWDSQPTDIRILVGSEDSKDNSLIGRHSDTIWKFNIFGLGFMFGYLWGKSH